MRKDNIGSNDTHTAWVWFFSGFIIDPAVLFVAKLYFCFFSSFPRIGLDEKKPVFNMCIV